MLRRGLGLVVLIGVIAMAGAEAEAVNYNYRGPFEGRVVDAETGMPIEGAVVFVEWKIRHFLRIPSFFDTVEVRTDANGRFSIPKNWSWLPWRNMVMDSQYVVLKAGYAPVEDNWQPILQAKAILERLPPAERDKPGAGCDWEDTNIILQCPKAVYQWYPIHIENGEAVFHLKKISTPLTHLRNIDRSFIPDDKHRVLSEELRRHNMLSNDHAEKPHAIGQEGGAVEVPSSEDHIRLQNETRHP